MRFSLPKAVCLLALPFIAPTTAIPFTGQARHYRRDNGTGVPDNQTTTHPGILGSDWPTAISGNPFIDGWYADPGTAFYNGQHWVYPTTSQTYEEQTYIDAFSSPDLIHWKKHPSVLTTDNIKWATRALWAPAPVARNGKYYLYFAANDLQPDEAKHGVRGGIGVAVADKPEGPYVDAIDKPLIGEYHHGAQPIDPDVFVDDDGQAYMLYGGRGHCVMMKLEKDMITTMDFADGRSSVEITPTNYTEGVKMFKRKGIYYLMWSEGEWTGPDYRVSFGMSDSVMGPFTKNDTILKPDKAVASGIGHNSVINIPDTDIWYIVYHRRPVSEKDSNHRVLAYDRMRFDGDETIMEVKMLVQHNFANGKAFALKQYGGRWSVADGKLTSQGAGVAMLDTDYADFLYKGTVAVPNHTLSHAGLLFRASGASDDLARFNGYYAKITGQGYLELEKYQEGDVYQLGRNNLAGINPGQDNLLKVRAVYNLINVYVGDMENPKISVPDDVFTKGQDGVRTSDAGARFGSLNITKGNGWKTPTL